VAHDGSLHDRTRIADTIRRLVAARGAASSLCPSEVARTLFADRWREAMQAVRDVARQLAADGEIAITQRGRPVDPRGVWRGPIRLTVGKAV
jgi:hypothetical protein